MYTQNWFINKVKLLILHTEQYITVFYLKSAHKQRKSNYFWMQTHLYVNERRVCKYCNKYIICACIFYFFVK